MKNLSAGMIIAASLLMTGCSSDRSSRSSRGQDEVKLASSANNGSSSPHNRLVSTSDGLEVRKLAVSCGSDLLGAALMRHADAIAVDPSSQSQLERNGFRLVRVPLDRLDALLEDLGGTTLDAEQWHGQAPEWRPLEELSITDGSRAIAVDGKVRRYGPGFLRLMIRSWSVQMEDGPAVHLECVPDFQRPRTNDLRKLLEEKQGQSTARRFSSIGLDLQLEDGMAYVLAGESPQISWPTNGEEAAERVAPKPPAPPLRPTVGPVDAGGPAGSGPLTIGEMMLAPPTQPPSRTLLVFIAHISPQLRAPTRQAAYEWEPAPHAQ